MGERPAIPVVDLSIVIVNWNSAKYVRACIASIVAETRSVAFEIIVVDNASFDSCRQLLAEDYPEVVFVQSHKNVGFGGANNLGAQRAVGHILLFLNPDTEVRNASVDRLYADFCRVADAGVVGCRLLNTDGSLQTSCVQALPTVANQILDAELLRNMAPRARLWGTQALFERSVDPIEVEAISGACMMVRRQVFEGVGGFSPAFFMYGEDIDLCARISRAGFRNVYVGHCEIVHHGGGSTRHAPSTFSVIMMCESVSLVLKRLRGPLASGTYRVMVTGAACVRLVILAATSPIWMFTRGTAWWSGAFRKWLAVLAWGMGLNPVGVPNPKSRPLAARS